MSIISRTADTFYAFRFLRLLTTPWEKTGAFKAGIIDASGNVIRKPDTSSEKKVYNIFHKLVFNIKRLLNKVPFGKSTIASYIAALYLIKENYNIEETDMLYVLKEFTDSEIGVIDLQENSSILEPGNYTLNKDIALPKTGEALAQCNTEVIVSSVLPKDTFMGYHIYEAFHPKTEQTIFISTQDLQEYECGS